MNSWVHVSVCVPSRAQQVALSNLSGQSSANTHSSDSASSVDTKTTSSQSLDKSMKAEVSLAQVIQKYINDNNIEAVWSSEKNYIFVDFPCRIAQIEEIISVMDEAGIGKVYNSSYRIIPCLYYKSKGITKDDNVEAEKLRVKGRREFLKVSKLAVPVQQVVKEAEILGQMDFDYFALLVCAIIIAATGLVEDNLVVLVASILVSPIMGPITAATIGFSIGNKHLYRMAVLNEVLSLALCLAVSFIFGIIYFSIEGWNNGILITNEMKLRGVAHSLAFSVLVGVPSGVGVGLSVLGKHIGPLVGVIISASLLPPVANAGILFALSAVKYLSRSEDLPFGYQPIYYESISKEAACLGAVSLCLSLISILCIFAMGLLVLKIKDVVPRSSGAFLQSCTEDLHIVKDIFLNKFNADHNGEHDPYKTTYGLAELFPDICFGHHKTRPQSPVVNEDTHPKLFDLWRGEPSHSKSSKAVEEKIFESPSKDPFERYLTKQRGSLSGSAKRSFSRSKTSTKMAEDEQPILGTEMFYGSL
ncbi:uncharacterized protein LOC136031780 [Artemia franciscana]|uniref:uncharacterized protein LOC136031780 n=1 Tax=Artemia franciscana TaxID=6661 RepID=UPI0032DB2AE7